MSIIPLPFRHKNELRYRMKSLVKKYEIHTRKNKVFEALTEPLSILQWSGDEAVMNPVKGGVFSLWSGSIHGENIQVTEEKIVQNWKEKDWDNYSTVIFNLIEENGKTTLELTHNDIPEKSFESINKGWDRYYLGPLKLLLERK